MDVELGFNIGDRYSIALLVFFITYFLFEIPSNIVLRKIGAANWLSFLCFSWGVVILGAGFTKKWTVGYTSKTLCNSDADCNCRTLLSADYCSVFSKLV
jgi:hypothetical protein